VDEGEVGRQAVLASGGLDAEVAERVSFSVGSATSLPATDASVDLVCVAQALHWFDLPAFYAEASRVLRSGTGVLAVWGYDLVELDNTAARAVVQQFHDDTLGDKYWDSARRFISARYASMAPDEVGKTDGYDPAVWSSCEHFHASQPLDASLEHLLGYLSTWSGYRTFLKQNDVVRGQAGDPLLGVEEGLRAAFEALPDVPAGDVSVRGTTPMFGFLTRKA
jgi:SAM-dependent methyltransferase